MQLVSQSLEVLKQPFAALSKFVGSQEFSSRVHDFSVLLDKEAKAVSETIRPELIAEIYSYLDITSLDSLDNERKIADFISHYLNNKISELKPAAFCVFPVFIKKAKKLLDGSQIQLAAVESAFPHGQSLFESRVADIKGIISAGADEVDAVIRRGLADAGELEKLEQEIAGLKAACGSKKLKIILNTQELHKDKADRLLDIYRVSKAAISARADMLKSSTGKEGINADLKDCIVMCRAILDFNPKTGFKAAGGIRTLESAVSYYLLAKLTYRDSLCRDHFRIGASSLAQVLHGIHGETDSYSANAAGVY